MDNERFKEINSEKDKNIVMEYLYARNVKVLTLEEERNLFIRYYNGDEDAKNVLFESNLPLVRSIVRQYRDLRLDYDDFFQVGAMGLMSAIENFDLNKEVKFSTYATEWIRGNIKKLIAQESRIIDVPNGMFWLVGKYFDYYYKEFDVIDREPTKEEVMTALEIDDLTFEKLEKAKFDALSFEELVENGVFNVEELVDYSVELFEDTVYREMLKPWSLDILDLLDDEKREILKHRFGLDGASSLTLAELGDMFGKSCHAVNKNMSTIMNHLGKTCCAKGQLEYEDELNTELGVALNKKIICDEVAKVIISALDDNIFSSDEAFIASLLFGLDGNSLTVDKVCNHPVLKDLDYDEKLYLINDVIRKYVDSWKCLNKRDKVLVKKKR